ncbi:MAG TPA: 30S ribosomal protein S10 [Candidatus Woesebacteria bacterium]|nr:30S ribosomal protein S10 [Candidatus Woesebacteria bacterium]HRT39808.1 30S ribosomal protein S10 [Candidatus Woesebacteria bacterium]
MVKGSRIRIKLKSFDHRLVDEAALKIVEAAVTAGAVVQGPIPLPTSRKIITVLTSPHTDKDAREHFEIRTHKRLIDISNTSLRTVDSLQHLDLPSGVEVEVKM